MNTKTRWMTVVLGGLAFFTLEFNAAAESVILAGWHAFDAGGGLYKTSASSKAADACLSGVSASLYGGDGSRSAWGSTDGTYGVWTAVETASTDGAMAHRTDRPDMFLTIMNNTGSDVVLESIVFDLASVSLNAPQDLALYYDSGDLAEADDTPIKSATGVNANGLGSVSNYADFNWSLATLADTTLANGETAVFRLSVANANNNLQALALDNLAILGEGNPPELDITLAGDTRAWTEGNALVVSTGIIERRWNWTGSGLATTSIRDLRSGKEWAVSGSLQADWSLPGVDEPGVLRQITATVADDGNFTSTHLEIISTIEYPLAGISVQHVVWAYPGAAGLRTQLRLLRTGPTGFADDAGTGETLPLEIGGLAVKAVGYYSDTQNRNTFETEILREEILSPVAASGTNDWSNLLDLRSGTNGLVLVKESHKCVTTPNGGANTGAFVWDAETLRSTGLGWYLDDLDSESFHECWAHWLVLYEGGDDEMALALKQWDRVRYPIDPARDIFLMANTWGSDRSKLGSYETNVLNEIETQAYLGIDVQQIDDGWQNASWRPDLPAYSNGWDAVRAHAASNGVTLGLWANSNISLENLKWNYDDAGFRYYKLDFANLTTMAKVEAMMQKARDFQAYTHWTSRINWDVTEINARFGYFFAREYGNIFLENRKLYAPSNVIYIPYLVQRDAWQVSKYLNLNKFQLNVQNPAMVDPAQSDAWRHSADYCVAQTLMGSPHFFQETHFYDQAQRDDVRDLLAIYKMHRNEMYAGYVFPVGDKPDNNGWSGFQNHNPETLAGYLMLLRQVENLETSRSIDLKFIAGQPVRFTDLQSGAEFRVVVPSDGRVEFSINDPADFRFFHYMVDADEDGQPDGWELLHGLDPADAFDAFGDEDGDGISNVDEYVQWSNPRLADSGLIGHWPFDATNGLVAADTSGHLHDGVLQDGAGWGGSPARNYLSCDGSGASVAVANLPDLTDALTIALWARSHTETWNSDGMLAARRPQFVLHPWNGTKKVSMIVYEAAGAQRRADFELDSIDGFDLMEWHHYAGSYDSASGLISLFVDGVLRVETNITATALSSDAGGSMWLGRDDLGNRYFDGALDGVLLYDRALAEDEIALLASGFDDDGDGLPDELERRMIEEDGFDGLQTLADVLPGDDFDGDGRSNGEEYAFGTDLFSKDAPVIDHQVDGSSLSILYDRRAGEGVRADWTISLTNLVWRTDNMTEGVVGRAGDIESVEAAVPLDAENKFIRVGEE